MGIFNLNPVIMAICGLISMRYFCVPIGCNHTSMNWQHVWRDTKSSACAGHWSVERSWRRRLPPLSIWSFRSLSVS